MGDDDLSDEELDSLISDLEGGGSSASASAEDVDMDALVEDADAEGGPAPTDLAEELPDDLPDPDLSDLEGDDDLPAEAESNSPAPTPNKTDGGEKSSSDAEDIDFDAGGMAASLEDDSGGEKQQKAGSQQSSSETESRSPASSGTTIPWGTWSLVALKWGGYALPIVAFGWLLGAYLAQWITAGWLIAAVSVAFTVGIPAALYRLAGERGKFRWWLAGTSLALTVGLVAPLQNTAGQVLSDYGYWPGAAVVEATGSGDFLSGATGAAGTALGGLLNPNVESGGRVVELGAVPDYSVDEANEDEKSKKSGEVGDSGGESEPPTGESSEKSKANEGESAVDDSATNAESGDQKAPEPTNSEPADSEKPPSESTGTETASESGSSESPADSP